MMSNKTTLQSHNERIQGLIDVANELPDAGGGGVETCTITINLFRNILSSIIYVSYEDGEYIYHDIPPEELINTTEITLENVMCGGTVAIYTTYSYCAWDTNISPFLHEYYASFHNEYDSLVMIPIKANTHYSIECMDDD